MDISDLGSEITSARGAHRSRSASAQLTLDIVQVGVMLSVDAWSSPAWAGQMYR